MARRPFAAIGVLETPHGRVLVRKSFVPRQKSFVLTLEGPHADLHLLLPDWRPRTASTRTQLTPPTRMPRAADVIAWFQSVLLPRWTERLHTTTAPAAPDMPTYTTLGQLVALVDQDVAGTVRASSLDTYRFAWSTLRRHLPDHTPLAQLTRDRLQALVSTLTSDGYTAATVRNLITALRRILARAVADGLLPRNPVDRLQRPKLSPPPRGRLTAEQRGNLLAVAEQHGRDLHLVVALGLLAGLRKSESLALRQRDTDHGARVLHIRSSSTFQTKSGRDRRIPMCDQLAQVLLRYRSGTSTSFVIRPSSGQRRGRYRWDFTKVFASAVVEAGLPPWVTPHTLRRAFASAAAAAGIGAWTIRTWLGHQSVATTERYVDLADGFDARINAVAAEPEAAHR